MGASVVAGSVHRGVTSAARITAANLRVDAATAEVLRGFDVGGARSILLKGASLTRWLSDPSDPRPYLDCDLLVPSADLTAAEQVLSDLGFRPLLDALRVPPGLEAAVEAALGPTAQALLAPSTEAARQAIELLRQRGAGRATLLVSRPGDEATTLECGGGGTG